MNKLNQIKKEVDTLRPVFYCNTDKKERVGIKEKVFIIINIGITCACENKVCFPLSQSSGDTFLLVQQNFSKFLRTISTRTKSGI